jgi:hypothetical protein
MLPIFDAAASLCIEDAVVGLLDLFEIELSAATAYSFWTSSRPLRR